MISFLLSPALRAMAKRSGHIDVPNERSSHRAPTPKSGGVAILIAILGASIVGGATTDMALVAAIMGAVILGGLALVDEFRALPRIGRLAAQILVAAGVMWVGGLATDFLGGWAFGPLLVSTILVAWMVGFVNVYNFMDGANGLASMQAVIGGSALAILLAPVDAPAAALAVAMVGAAAGFLPWNFPKASVFMGDSGSNAFGIVLAALIVRAADGGVPFVLAALPFAPFLLDASVTVAIRAARREAFFRTPHRSHFYQRLLDRGWTHAQVTGAWSGLAVVSAAAALLDPWFDPPAQAIAVGTVLLLHVAVAVAILATTPRHRVAV